MKYYSILLLSLVAINLFISCSTGGDEPEQPPIVIDEPPSPPQEPPEEDISPGLNTGIASWDNDGTDNGGTAE
jgi:hypothetical protein